MGFFKRLLKAFSFVKKLDEAENDLNKKKTEIESIESVCQKMRTDRDALTVQSNDAVAKAEAEQKKLDRLKFKYKSLSASFKAAEKFLEEYRGKNTTAGINLIALYRDLEKVEASDVLVPTTELELHSTSIPDLRKKSKLVQSQIETAFENYTKGYVTKSSIAIYSLMVIALRAEFQNILTAMKYDALDKSIDRVRDTTNKYLSIAYEGNKLIAPTLKKFIGEIELLFIDLVKIEYEYYVRRERAKEEQRAIREQMKQDAAERKELERQQKKIEAEESKFEAELEKLRAQLASAEADATKKIEARMAELENQLSSIEEKKSEITLLQHGKAGYVYIISNLGAFGDEVFKIGMTRRLVPQERIDELGNASVPFPFDVHATIFSEDAVALETELHHRLHEQRVNKVNLRKEFFRSTIDDLEKMVNEIDPTVSFTKTMLAEQFRQSESMSYVLQEDDENAFEDDEEE